MSAPFPTPEDISNWPAWAKCVAILVMPALGGVGGVVRRLQQSKTKGGPIPWLGLVVDFFTAAFAGVVVMLCLAHTDLPVTAQGAGVAVSGYAAPELLALASKGLLSWLCKRFGINAGREEA